MERDDLQAVILIQTLFISESCGRKEKDVVSTISRDRIIAFLSNVNHVGYISRQHSQTLVTTGLSLSYRNANNFSLSLSLSSTIFSFYFFPNRVFNVIPLWETNISTKMHREHFFVRCILREISRGDAI